MARGKSITHFCHHCEREAKMEMIGTVESQPERTWYRCTRCRHASLLDTGEWKRTQEEAKRKVDKSECLEYRPSMTYNVGQAIFHSGLDDMGRIISKERTSNGAHAIVVSFEKAGERRLLEKVADD
jgi:DNA-directed RNA polymerase subunit RPC12/RpoP